MPIAQDKISRSGVSFRLLLFLTFFLLLIVNYRFWFFLPARFLLVEDKLGRSDCIVPLGGNLWSRYSKAAQLYHQGYARAILVSATPERYKELRRLYDFEYILLGLGEVTRKDIALRALRYFGVKTEDIFFTDNEVTSTFDEAVATCQFMQQKGWRSLILITDTYHMRRVLLVFSLVFKNTGITIFNSTAVNPLDCPRRWWERESDAKAVLLEYISLAHNLFYHFVLGKTRTAFDD